MTSTLPDLAKDTAGLQPWRRAFHATNGMIVAGVLWSGILPRWVILWGLGILLFLALLLDVLRLANPAVNHLFFRYLTRLASPRELTGIASSTWYLLGILLTLVLLPEAAALGGILVLALADPAANIVGRLWGRMPLGGGTVEGTAVFFLVAFAVLIAVSPWHHALAAALGAAAVEAIPWGVDDNLSVPLAAGLVLVLLGG